MKSTMLETPLTVSRILEHGSTVHGASRITTWTGGAPRHRSFQNIGTRAARLAHALRGLGVDGDQRVATLMWNNAEHVEAYLAVPSMGAVLHTLNLRLPVDQLTWIVNHAADHVLIVDGTLLELAAALLPGLTSVQHVIVSGPGDRGLVTGRGVAVHEYEDLISQHSDSYAWPEVDEKSAAVLCYTSGTTGDPKGVAYSHRSIYLHSLQVNTTESVGMNWRDTVLPVVPMFHVGAWGIPHGAFMSGASLLLPDRFLQPAALADMIELARPALAAAVPTIWTGLLSELDARPRDVSSLRAVIVGGSACPPSLMRDFEERHGMRLIHVWGMTETSPLGAMALPPAGLDPEQEWAYRVTQGRFPASVQARLVDGAEGEVLPHDGKAVGELQVRGPWIAGSYYGGARAENQRPSDKFSADGWLRTGDLGSISPDGYLTLTDRVKDVIKSGGEWISSVDLENHLMAHSAVAEAAVIGVPDDQWGERPLAVVVLKAGVSEDVYHDLCWFLATRVARWQVPERWTSVQALPKTSVGKADKKALRKAYADGGFVVSLLPPVPAQ
ncbi:long-chain fatty acid--CoA ligase [Streptomyces sp. NPDC001083]|uniref:long-chain fatty acid--CoA ligase n=1 Tax=Streptomyces sp. NPDC001083 TaxID=3364545 RepID=UPI0036B6AC6C